MKEKNKNKIASTKGRDTLRFWLSGNKTARAVKLCTVRDFVASARKDFMKKVHRRPWCQE